MELASVCQPFGAVENVLMMAEKSQAFVQMQSIESAHSLLVHYTSSPCNLRGKTIYFQFSAHAELINKGQPVQQQQSLGTNPFLQQQLLASNTGMSMYGGVQGFGGQGGDPPSAILLVTVLDVRVPVTIENLHEIFRPYGQVQKILIFSKNDQFKALVQLGSVESAIAAKAMLEGKDIFQGCCKLQIQFSRLPAVNIKENGPRARDYTIPDPVQSMGLPYQGGGGMGFGTQMPAKISMGTPQMFPNPFGAQAQAGLVLMDPRASQARGGVTSALSGLEKGAVLLVNGLPEDTTPDQIFMLFGVYGDVARVKIMFNKRSTALVQFFQAAQAQVARQYLNECPFFGGKLQVTSSKHPELTLPRSSEEGKDLTKDYQDSPAHRYRGRNAKNASHIHAPSAVLFLSGIAEGMGESDVRDLFTLESAGAPRVEFFKENKRLAYVCMASVADAVVALVKNHNTKVSGSFLRVGFSPKDPSAVAVGNAAAASSDAMGAADLE